ncbi:hypothetical protein A9798_08580 [Edwardsiella hoshinae]|uniref:Lipoprotein n=1 Tax=Edwardsiella hoshinae TaxID=93378 RepID=A0A376DFD6_9GAMM|nr:hypothetical protein [Edwardsiella hoshinae]AOV97017.1 hypothetical protein A9798_08580 [Edwardsiella hoshinae]QPR27133.1 hypothetical protein I6G97_11855 [Edwardsiella hoshinae]STC88371.1 Uncharacterised protein [Edwardsiella hoshinae]
MKPFLSLLAAAWLLSACSAPPEGSNPSPHPFRSSFQCDVPLEQDFPPVQSASDLLVNMQHMSQRLQAGNFVAGQWLAQNATLSERDHINACHTALLQGARRLIEAQYQVVYPQLQSAAQRDALQAVMMAWRSAMQGITPQGVNDQQLAAYAQAAQQLRMLLPAH